MISKLLHLGTGRHQQNSQGGNGDKIRAQSNPPNPVAKPAVEAPMNVNVNANAKSARIPPHQGRLLSLPDIYIAVGIMSSRHGYSIDSISAMLESEHLQGMTNDVKRASILMALEAAGVPAKDLLQDGTQRLDALNSYESSERKLFEEYEERKAQENAQIQLEIERVNAHFVDRMEKNKGEVESARDAFLSWQIAKQKEAQRISEVIALFTKSSAAAPTPESKPGLQEVVVNSKQ